MTFPLPNAAKGTISNFVFKIVQEIQEYKKICKEDEWKSPVSVITHLQGKRTYSHLKYHTLKTAVKEALEIVSSSDSLPEEIDADPMEIVETTPSLNSLLAQSYKAAAANEDHQRKRKAEEGKKESKKTKTSYLVADRPKITYKDFGGIEACLDDIKKLIERPFLHPQIYRHLGVELPKGILLFGPPGCGKTSLAHAICNELNANLLKISAPEIVSGMSGESEAKVRELFEEARKQAPCIVFIDEIDAITPKRETAQREMERRIVAQLLTSMDDISLENTDFKPVLVIGATNRPDSIDPALRRAGRFDREIKLGIPSEEARCKILQVFSQKLRIRGSFDFLSIARKTPGYVGADLKALVREAASVAIERILVQEEESAKVVVKQNGESLNVEMSSENVIEETMSTASSGLCSELRSAENSSLCSEPMSAASSTLCSEPISTSSSLCSEPISTANSSLSSESISASSQSFSLSTPPPNSFSRSLASMPLESLFIEEQDFLLAIPKVQPSAKREGFAVVPDTTWNDIGALAHILEELRMSIVEPLRHPEKFKAAGILSPVGLLLWGPPGCGKTLLAKAIANESHSNFISIKGPELLNKYVGESERSVRQVFERARASAPCVIFFDELDALCPKRDSDVHSSRVVNQLLTEMDGLNDRKNVFIIAATNRPDIIDPAIMRPGRLDKLLYVDLPNQLERAEILKTITKNSPLASEVDLNLLAADSRCNHFSGADLTALVREAAMASLKEQLACVKEVEQHCTLITIGHFNIAFGKVFPSVSAKDRQAYADIKRGFCAN